MTMDHKEIFSLFLTSLGEDPQREGLNQTFQRVQKMSGEFFTYHQDPPAMTFFESPQEQDEMILVQDIQVHSFCEHHLLPFIGKADIAYVPDKKIVGLSKIPRVVQYYSSRLQVQERLTQEICSYLFEQIHPKGVLVLIKAEHYCMKMRGVKEPCSTTTTLSQEGKIDRNEFWRLLSLP